MKKILVTGVISFFLCSALSSPLLGQEGEYEKAIRAYLEKDYAGAVTYFKTHMTQRPSAEASYLLGYAHYKLKNREESARYFRDAYQIDPNFSPRKISFPGKKKQ